MFLFLKAIPFRLKGYYCFEKHFLSDGFVSIFHTRGFTPSSFYPGL